VIGDTLSEATETFLVNLSSPVNAILRPAQGRGTITDDDPLPSVALSDVNVREPATGSNTAVFAATLSTISGRIVTVQYATADGTALAGSDYAAQSGTLTFPAGVTNQSLAVWVLADSVVERNETFAVNLSAPNGATIGRGQGLATIQDEDFRITSIKVVGSNAIVSFATIINSSNRLEQANPLLATNVWKTVAGATNIAGTGGIVTVTNSGAASQSRGFFRVRLLP
jgi:hypothetical protein